MAGERMRRLDAEIELAWAEETERRYQEALARPSSTEPAEQRSRGPEMRCGEAS